MLTTSTPVTKPQDNLPRPANRSNKLWRRLSSNKAFSGSIAFAAFIGVFIAYGIWLGNSFINAQARILDIHQNAPVLLLGMAVLVVLIAGQFDLSVASMATLTCVLTVGLKVDQNWPFAAVIVACLAVGLVGGFINGLLIVRVKVNAFIATLATGGIFLGLSAVYSKGDSITPGVGLSKALPKWFAGAGSFGAVSATVPSVLVWIAFAGVFVVGFFSLRKINLGLARRHMDILAGTLLAIVAAVLIAVLNINSWVERISWTTGFLFLVAMVMWLLLDLTTFGRYLRATGSNPVAARLAGVNPGKETIKAFVLAGLLAATAGIVLAANQGSAAPNIATGYLLPAFAAAFLSTVVLSSGRFHVWGTVVGGIFLVWVTQGLIVGGLAYTWTEIVDGVVLVGAVSLATVFRRTS